MSINKIKVGLIGCGMIGLKRANHLPENALITHVFDVNAESAANLASQIQNSVTVSNSIESLLEVESIDAILIATTHASLPVIARLAIRARKHVLIEKPGSNDLEQLNELQQLAKANGVVVHVGFNHRFHPSILKAKALIDSGEYGNLLWLRARYGHGGRLGYETEWRAKKEISGGGELIDQGSHLIDLTRFLVGDVTLAFAELQTSFWEMDVEDNAFIALKPNRGGFAWLHASWTEWKNTFSLEVAMSTAKMELVGLGGSYGAEQMTLFLMQPEMGPPPSEKFTWDNADTSWSLELADFFSAMRNGSTVGASLNDAIQIHSIMKEIYNG